MKKMLSIAAIAALATSSFAASDLAGAFKEGKASGQIRAMYIGNDLSSAANDAGSQDKSAFALGGKLGFETAPLYGISAGAVFYTSQDLGTKNKDVAKRNVDMLDENGNSYSLLGQAYVVGSFAKTTVKVGRQQIDTPLAASDDARMIPNLFEAALVINTDVPNTTLIGGYVSRMAGWDSFSDKSSRTQFQSMSRSALNTLSDSAEIGDHGVYVVAAVNSSIKDLTLQAWYYNAVDVLTAPYLQADYALGIANGVKLTVSGQYFALKSQGKTKNFLDANSLKLDYSVYGLKAALALENIGLTPYVAYNSVSDKEGGLYATNTWGGLPEFTNMEEANLNQGYVNGTNSVGYLTTGTSGATAYKVGVDYSLEKLGLGARTLTVAYGSYDLKDSRNGNVDSDYKVYDLVYTCSGALVKNLDARLAYEKVDNQIDTKDQTWLKVIFNYNF
jgi:imipenem/basic amino acid-specific outer membrane pore